MNLILRQEQPSDYLETEHVTREAFWNQYAPGCTEHYLLHIMREHTTFIPELDIVAVDQGAIIGNVICMKAMIKGDDGKPYEVLSLGPISVLPKYQNKGVGGKLIRHVKSLAKEMGFQAVLLCGDPDYYLRQGFIPAETLGIRTADNKYMDALMVCELDEGALADKKGRYYEDAVYEVDASDVAEFDKGFPVKEKVTGTPSQERFMELVALQRSADE